MTLYCQAAHLFTTNRAVRLNGISGFARRVYARCAGAAFTATEAVSRARSYSFLGMPYKRVFLMTFLRTAFLISCRPFYKVSLTMNWCGHCGAIHSLPPCPFAHPPEP